MRAFGWLCAGIFALLWLAAPAAAQPPANAARPAPRALSLPARVGPPSAEATTDPDEPFSNCGSLKNSVWYAFTATSSRELLVALDAAGDMDAIVDVFVRQRSQITPVECARTNRNGQATLDIDEKTGTDYLIRVAPLNNSVAAAFTLRVLVPEPPATPPGAALPARGVTDRVERLANPDNAYAVRLGEGVTYRITLVTAGSACTRRTCSRPAATGTPRSARSSATARRSTRRPRPARTRSACRPRGPPARRARTTCRSAARGRTTPRPA